MISFVSHGIHQLIISVSGVYLFKIKLLSDLSFAGRYVGTIATGILKIYPKLPRDWNLSVTIKFPTSVWNANGNSPWFKFYSLPCIHDSTSFILSLTGYRSEWLVFDWMMDDIEV